MLSKPIKISDQASIMQQVLDGWANPRGGKAVVASSLQDFWIQAYNSSQKPRILICYRGEKARGPFEVMNALNRVDRQWIVAITRGRGFTANRGDTLFLAKGEVEPFYDSVESVRDLIRSILNISEEQPTVDYSAIKSIQMGTLVIDGYTIEFSTANDIPFIRTTTENDGSGAGHVLRPSGFGIRGVANEFILGVGGENIEDVGGGGN